MKCIVIFAKAPIPGEVKTRLCPPLSPGKAAIIHEAFVIDTLDTLKNVKGVDIYLACHPGIDHDFFTEVRDRFGISLVGQGDGTLGDRM